MKGKFLKKLVASVSALSMLASFAFVVPASADDLTLGAGTESEPYVNIDFSADKVESKVWGYTSTQANVTGVESTDGWLTYYVGSANRNGGSIAVKDDGGTGYVNYASANALQFADADANNTREPSIKINKVPELTSLAANNVMVYQFDFRTTNVNGAIYLNNNDGKTSGDFIKMTLTKCPVDTWLKAVVTIDPSNKQCIAQIYNGATAVDAQTVAYTATGSPSRFRFLGAGAVSNNCTYSLDNIKIYSKQAEVSYTITYVINDTTSTEIVTSGNKISNIPSTTLEGKIFDGWKKGDSETLLSDDALKALAIDSDLTFTAVYHDDPTYVEKIKTIEFAAAKTDAIKPSTETGKTDSYTYTAKVTSEIKTDLSNACTYTWEIVGAEKDDGYIGLYPTDGTPTAVLKVREGVSDYVGYIKVTANYVSPNSKGESDHTSASIQIPFAIIASTGSANLIPAVGYPVDMSDYADSLVGYKATADGINSRDMVLNNWSIYGSNGSRTLKLTKLEDGSKALEFASNGGGGSTVGVYQWAKQTSEYIVDTTIKLPTDASIGVYSNTPNNSGITTEFSVAMRSASLQSVQGVGANNWYRLVIICDPASGKYYTKVYNADTNALMGETEAAATGKGADMKYLCVYGGWPISVKSLRAYSAVPKTMTISSDKDAVKVPEDETVAEVDLSATCLDADGNKLLSNVVWSLDSDYANVELEGEGQTAKLKVSKDASGEIVVKAANGSATAEKTIRLTTSANTVSVTGERSITIPFDGEEAVEATYTAKTLDPDGQPITGEDTITLALLQKDGVTEYTTMPTGIAFDAAAGKLTVSAGAPAGTVYVKATNAEGLSSKTSVNIHGMSYAFGSTIDEESGYTQVTAATTYSDRDGYGFASTAGLTDAATSVSGSAAYVMQVKVPNGNYKVTLDTTSQLVTNTQTGATATGVTVEAVSDSSATGISKFPDANKSFNVAVCDGILDVTFSADSSVSSMVISQLPKNQPAPKPAVFAIGDSTTKNKGISAYDTYQREQSSWGNQAEGHRELWSDTFSSFTNKGNAGKNVASYYRLGDLESILLAIAPGDYVTVNMGINSEANMNFDKLMEYYYIQGILQRGGIPVIMTHTPDGPDKGGSGKYNTATGKFEVYRDHPTLMRLADKYDLDIIDVSTYGENYFNSLTEADFDKANTNCPAPTTVLELVQTWYTDHNHYTAELALPLATYIMGELSKIANGGGTVDPPTPPVTTYTVSFLKEDDSVLKTVTVNDGETVTSIPTVPAKAGFTGKWYIGDTDVEFTAATVIDANTTVKPKYTALDPSKTVKAIAAEITADGILSAQVKNTTDDAVTVGVMVAYYNENGTLAAVHLATEAVAAGATATIANAPWATDVVLGTGTPKGFIWNMGTGSPIERVTEFE